jgi:hypothetical protein
MAVQIVRTPLHHVGYDLSLLSRKLAEAKSFCRSKASRKRFEKKVGVEHATTPEELVAQLENAISLGAWTPLQHVMSVSLNELPRLRRKLASLAWSPLAFSDRVPSFITSDDPVRLTLPHHPKPKLEDIDQPGAQVFFPISPKVLVLGRRPPAKKILIDLPGSFVAKVNEMMQAGATQLFSQTERFVTIANGKVKEARFNPQFKAMNASGSGDSTVPLS